MTSPASVGGDEHLRLFCALRLPEHALRTVVRWQRTAFAEGAGLRIVPAERLHVTLAFLGRTPAAAVGEIVGVLREVVAACGPIVLSPLRYRETRSVGMLVLDDEGARAKGLAAALALRLEALGVYTRERRPWLPHLTVLRLPRGHARPGRAVPVPELGPMSPSDAALYHSVLRSRGAQYEVIEAVALGG